MCARPFCKITVQHALPGTGGFDFGSRSAPFEGAATPKAPGSAGRYLLQLDGQILAEKPKPGGPGLCCGISGSISRACAGTNCLRCPKIRTRPAKHLPRRISNGAA